MRAYIFNCFSILFLAFNVNNAFAQCNDYPQVNAVINGDFESGYIAAGPGSFATDQLYVYDPANAPNSTLMDAVIADPSGAKPCAWNSDGKYHIASYYGTFRCDGPTLRDGHPFLTEAIGGHDHTKGIGGGGKYLMVDSKPGGGSTIYGVKIWEQNVNVYANTFYYFSGWFTNFTPNSTGGARAQLRFVVQAYDGSNNPIGAPVELGASAWSPAEASRGNNWEQYYNTWTSPIGAVTAKLGIYNQSGIAIGNDVAIDDISFINGCQAIASLTSPPAPVLPATFNLCSTSGSYTINPGVATNAGAGRTFTWYSGTSYPQTILVNNSTTQNTYTVSSPGTYRVCVYEPGGCSKSATIVITNTNSVSLSPNPVSLCNPNSSTQLLTSTLGTSSAFYNYSWQRNGTPIGGASSSTYTANQTGTYTVFATHTSIAACNVNTNSVVNNTNTMTASIGPDVNACNSSNATFTSSLTGSAFTYQWKKDGSTITGATSPSYTATQTGAYEITLTHPVLGCNVTASANFTSTNSITPTHNSFCTGNNVTLSVAPNATCPYKWYTAATGGSLVSNGTCSYTSSPAATTTYYVEDTTNVSYTNLGRNVTAANVNTLMPNPLWDYGNEGFNKGLIFTTTKKIVIVSVDIWVQEWASISNFLVQVQNGSGTILGTSAPVSYNNGTASPFKITVPLNITVPVGTGNKMIIPATSGTGAVRFDAGSLGGPYNSPGGGLSINGSTNARYNFFSNWAIKEYTNPCARIGVTATLTTPCTTPVTFVTLTVTKEGNSNFIKWSTSSELNADKFIIERSFDGIDFYSIGSVKATGNSKNLIEYSYTDLQPLDGMSYYRIREVDFDGSATVSSIKSVNRTQNGTLSIYPNPSTGLFNIHLPSVNEGPLTITVRNITGRIVIQESSSNPEELINLEDFPSGIYYVQVNADGELISGKLIKQ